MNLLKVHQTLQSTHMLSDYVGKMDKYPDSVQLCVQICILDEICTIFVIWASWTVLAVNILSSYRQTFGDNSPLRWMNPNEKWTGQMDALWFYGPFNSISVI